MLAQRTVGRNLRYITTPEWKTFLDRLCRYLANLKSHTTEAKADGGGYGTRLNAPWQGGERHHLLPASLSVSAVRTRKDFAVCTVNTLMGSMRSETLKSPSRSQTERQAIKQ